jgi:hypothetical protein
MGEKNNAKYILIAGFKKHKSRFIPNNLSHQKKLKHILGCIPWTSRQDTRSIFKKIIFRRKRKHLTNKTSPGADPTMTSYLQCLRSKNLQRHELPSAFRKQNDFLSL